MNILSVDTSGFRLGVGIAASDGRFHARRWDTDNHSAPLFQRMSEVVTSLGLNPAQIDLLAVVSGPGSFTGLRIGMAGLLGWGAALGKPVQHIDTFSAMRDTIPDEYSPLLIAVHSRKDAFYCKLFGDGTDDNGDPFIASPDSLHGSARFARIYLGGPAASKLHASLPEDQESRYQLLGEEHHFPDMVRVCKLAQSRYESSRTCADELRVEPYYMSLSQAEIKFDSHGGTA